MAEKVFKLLSDKQTIPTDELIFSIIGKNKIQWMEIMNFVHKKYDDAIGEWRYYNDGKQWLFKLVRKKKTVFWIGLFENTFRVTFWFGNKAEPVITGSDLTESIKDEFISAKRYGVLRAITIKIDSIDDVENVKKLIELKVKLK